MGHLLPAIARLAGGALSALPVLRALSALTALPALAALVALATLPALPILAVVLLTLAVGLAPAAILRTVTAGIVGSEPKLLRPYWLVPELPYSSPADCRPCQ